MTRKCSKKISTKTEKTETFCYDRDSFGLDQEVAFKERERKLMVHFLYKELWDRNFLSPVESQLKQGIKVLEVG